MTDKKKTFFLASFILNRVILEEMFTQPEKLDLKWKEDKKVRM